jgi:hypothetical protein
LPENGERENFYFSNWLTPYGRQSTTPRIPETVSVMRNASTTSSRVASAAFAIGTCPFTAISSPIAALSSHEYFNVRSMDQNTTTGRWRTDVLTTKKREFLCSLNFFRGTRTAEPITAAT